MKQKKSYDDISKSGEKSSEVSLNIHESRVWLTLSCAVRVLQGRSVAFVTYVRELDAQFAKESMACQSLDNDEILNVRCDSIFSDTSFGSGL